VVYEESQLAEFEFTDVLIAKFAMVVIELSNVMILDWMFDTC